jgi:transcriptional regulator with GAF, ATPase, and Fis domain
MAFVPKVVSRERDHELARLTLLYELSRSFSELIELDQLISRVITRTKDLLGAESCAILLLDEERQELFFPYSSDVAPEVEQRFATVRFPADRGIAGWVLQHGMSQHIPDVSKDERWYANVDKQSGMSTHSLLCAPLRTQRGTLGVIELRNRIGGTFDEDDLQFLDALAANIAVALENARLYQTVKDSEAKLRDEVVILQREVVNQNRFVEVVGTSDAMQHVFHLMESAITWPVTVLVTGETGTGKELIARAIHYHGARHDRPFVAVNCGALPETLLESELFGHKRGAFTGAVADRKGFFEVADGGTILLDEIGETTPAMQVKLLRVLQSGEMVPVGETTPRFVDVRIISATNRDLEQETEHGRFRRDLFYRLSTFPITLPPLRERKDDIPLLAAHILTRTAAKFGKPAPRLSPAAVSAFMHYAWPGNVRELENEIERAIALVGTGDTIQPGHLSEKLTAKRLARSPVGAQPMTLRRARHLFEAEYIADVLRQNGNNASRAARLLGISRVTLQTKIREYKLRKAKSPQTGRSSKS